MAIFKQQYQHIFITPPLQLYFSHCRVVLTQLPGSIGVTKTISITEQAYRLLGLFSVAFGTNF